MGDDILFLKPPIVLMFFLHLVAMRERGGERAGFTVANLRRHRGSYWNGTVKPSQKATASALSGDCHQQFGLKEWLLMLKCLRAGSIFFLHLTPQYP